MSPWEWCIVHDRPVKRYDWSPVIRDGSAFCGLAIILYFAVQIFLAKHLALNFKLGSIAVIVAIGIVGALAILQRDPDDELGDDGRRLYTAEEVAELLNAVHARCRDPRPRRHALSSRLFSARVPRARSDGAPPLTGVRPAWPPACRETRGSRAR